jgi:serine/threonine protein kinase/tetratricopeptide (TPR) repeat protein
MSSDRWERIREIFDAAVEQSETGRDAFVSNACNGDGELEATLRGLLAAHDHAGSFLESPPTTPASLQLPPAPANHTLAEGSMVSQRFRILRFLGEGGMGQVYEALDTELNLRVALKTIRPDISADRAVLSRFKQEVLLALRITHPNVCRMFGIQRHVPADGDGTGSGFIFLTMELLVGETLTDMLHCRGRLTTGEALPLVLQLVDALSAAHAAGIVHRDFKPGNVILVPARVPSSGEVRVVVTDFGLARAVVPDGHPSAVQAAITMTAGKGPVGTLVYMAPEQLERGEATPASDIYALGLVMYEMVTGQRPFADPIPFAEASKRIKQAAPSPKILVPDLDPRWEAAIGRCLEAEPGARPQSARQVGEEITLGRQDQTSASRVPEARKSHEGTVPGMGPRLKKMIGIAILLSAMALFSILFRIYQVRVEPKLAGGATVLLTEMQNSTGDKRFDDTTELIRHQLLQSPYFNLMDAGRIRDVLTQMTKPANAPLDPQTAREVALRSGAPRVIFGVVSRVGDSYVLDIDIEQPDNNPRRSRAQWENHWTWNMSSGTSDKEIPSGFLSAVRDSSDWIRSQVGESANDIATIDAPPQDVTTDNWAALSEFAQAENFKAARQDDNAIVALQNAVVADPHFALAYTRLGDVLVSLGRSDEGYRAYRTALAEEQQHRLTRREKLRLEGIYASDTEDYKAAESIFRDYTVYYPNDYLGWFYRATPLMMMGRVEEAIASLKKAEAIDSTKLPAPAHIARFDLILGNFGDASKWIQHLRNIGFPNDADLIEGQSDFLQGRYPESEEHFARLKDSDNPVYRSYAYSLLTRLFAEMGQYRKALDSLEEGLKADRDTGNASGRADKLLDRAYIDFKHGQYDACLRDTRDALDLDRTLQRSLAAGTLLGQAAAEAPGEMKAQLTAQLRKIEAQLPPGDFKPFSDVVRAHLRGEVLLAEGNWKPALDELRKADQLEAPTKEKEYLARALLAAARHTTDEAAATKLREDALAEYSVLALKPGLVWQWSQDYSPGYLSDSVWSAAKLASQLKKFDARIETELDHIVTRRNHADPWLRDAAEAQVLLGTNGGKLTTNPRRNQ